MRLSRGILLAMVAGWAMPLGARTEPRPISTMTPAGNPGAIVAAEGNLAHLVHDKGATAALIATADADAQVLAPARMPAAAYLKHHDGGLGQDGRHTRAAWVACDGSAGISAGVWGDDAGVSGDGKAMGWFATVWKRQAKRGDYRWTLAMAAPLTQLPAEPEWITGKTADCPVYHGPGAATRPLPAPVPAADAGSDSVDGRSADGSLVWRSGSHADGSRSLTVWMFIDGAMQPVLTRDSAPGTGKGA